MQNTEGYGIVYKIRNKVDNKIYFGVTTQKGGFDRRYTNNIEKCTRNKHLKNSIQKYGIDNFEIDKEFDVAYSKEELDKLEDMYIKLYDTTNPNYGYNKMYGGSNGKASEETKMKIGLARKGNHHSEETKMKLSDTKTGEKNPNYGKHHSEKTKLKMHEAHKGEKNWNYGNKMSEEQKLKISKAQRKLNNIQALEIREKHLTGKYKQFELAIEYSVSRSTIRSVINFKGTYKVA